MFAPVFFFFFVVDVPFFWAIAVSPDRCHCRPLPKTIFALIVIIMETIISPPRPMPGGLISTFVSPLLPPLLLLFLSSTLRSLSVKMVTPQSLFTLFGMFNLYFSICLSLSVYLVCSTFFFAGVVDVRSIVTHRSFFSVVFAALSALEDWQFQRWSDGLSDDLMRTKTTTVNRQRVIPQRFCTHIFVSKNSSGKWLHLEWTPAYSSFGTRRFTALWIPSPRPLTFFFIFIFLRANPCFSWKMHTGSFPAFVEVFFYFFRVHFSGCQFLAGRFASSPP